MTDEELIERLRDWPYQGETMAGEAANRIEALTADREALITARDMMGRQWAKDAEARLAAEARAERLEAALRIIAGNNCITCSADAFNALFAERPSSAALKGADHD